MARICPCPSFTAYWLPPPVLPRRILCELPSKLLHRLHRLHRLAAVAILLTYFFVMDIFLFARFRHTSLAEDAAAAPKDGELYSPFTHLTVKAVLSDHPRHYIFTPTTELFNAYTGFTEHLPFVSANSVSLTHLICAFISGKFVASENLSDRRIGVGLFFFRTWLDSFDGIVYRAHAGRYLQYNSGYSSIGYIIDGLFDTLGGYFLSFGVLFHLWKRFGVLPSSMSPKHQEKSALPVWTKPNSRTAQSTLSSAFTTPPSEDKDTVVALLYAEAEADNPTLSSQNISSSSCHECGNIAVRPLQEGAAFTKLYIFLRVLAYGLALLVAGGAWDRAIKWYTEVFQVQISDPKLAVLQFELSHSWPTLTLFFVWRFISGQTLLTYLQVAIYADKLWEYIQHAPVIFLSITLPLYGATFLHIQYMRQQLQL